jgi:hypothetical protein
MKFTEKMNRMLNLALSLLFLTFGFWIWSVYRLEKRIDELELHEGLRLGYIFMCPQKYGNHWMIDLWDQKRKKHCIVKLEDDVDDIFGGGLTNYVR